MVHGDEEDRKTRFLGKALPDAYITPKRAGSTRNMVYPALFMSHFRLDEGDVHTKNEVSGQFSEAITMGCNSELLIRAVSRHEIRINTAAEGGCQALHSCVVLNRRFGDQEI
jgi:hypothetical protein